MVNAKTKILIATVLCATLASQTLTFTQSVMAATKADTTTETLTKNDEYAKRFMTLRNKISDPDNGYFQEFTNTGETLKVPYHSVETFMVEAPDYGHETTSEAFSYYMWLEAMYGKFTNEWKPFENSWKSAEAYIIPSKDDQPGMEKYDSNKPATFANEYLDQTKYPSKLDTGAKVGRDPLSKELDDTYGPYMYGMHWLLDVDNWYGYGNHGKKESHDAPVYINTYQRGASESCFETVPQPSWEGYQAGGKNGFLDLFTGDKDYSKQWRYTNAPDADARAIQATYWAKEWAAENGASSSLLKNDVSKASKMGDFLRYSFYDKYFRNIGTGSKEGEQNTPEHYLMSWYYAWGGSAGEYPWSWKIGCSHNHFGYQNPMAAWILSNDSSFKPKSQNGKSEWGKSLDRQLELYEWLQSSEGAIAGGATNSYTTDQGSYQKYPAGTSTFHGMAYDPAPVYHDPDSNNWFGMQVWSMQRVAELYYKTGDERAERVLNKWVSWIKDNVHLLDDGTYEVPGTLSWSGQPDTWNGTSTGNPDLHCEVVKYSTDIGTTSSLANTLTYYAAGTKEHAEYDDEARELAKQLLDRMWNNCQDEKGLSVEEKMDAYYRIFKQEVVIPQGWTGLMGNGEQIKTGIKFIDIRSKYKEDPDYERVKEAVDNGEDPTFRYHRFWAQSEAAIANGTYSLLFGVDNIPGDVDDDGEVTALDLMLLKKYTVGIKVDINKQNADLNGDGKINLADVVKLREKLAK